MAKEYKHIQVDCDNLKQFIETMEGYRERGELVETTYCGYLFHSDTVADDLKKAQEDVYRREKEMEAAEKAEMREKLPKMGREILDEKYWTDWDLMVEKRVDGIYNGRDLEDCLEIVDALNKGKSVEEANAILNAQDHSGASYGMVIFEVAGFCDRGLEFAEHIKGHEWVQDYKDARMKEDQAKAVAKHQLEDQQRREKLYAKGREVLDEKYLGRWDELVDWKMERSMYQGADLEIAAEMIDVLNNGGSVADAKAILDSQSWGSVDMSAPIIAQVTEMCDRGQEFNDYVHQENTKDLNDHAPKSKFYADYEIIFEEGQKYGHVKNDWWGDLENFVKQMQAFEANGLHVEADFNGRIFYSDTITMDDAYLKVTGYTKDEFDRAVEAEHQRALEEERQYKARLPELKAHYIEAGQALIAEDKWSEWERCVDIRLGGLYKGADLEASLELMTQLSNGMDFADVRETLNDQDHSGASYGIVVSIVRSFSDQGEEFSDFLKGIEREDRGPVIGE